MELTCPACSARYTVPVTAIPASGRVVRCSNCRAEWRAEPPATKAAGDPPQSAVSTAVPQQPDAPHQPPEPVTEPAPPPAPDAGLQQEAAEPRAIEAPEDTGASSPSLVARREARDEQGTTAHALAMSLDDETPARQGGGFLAGFAAVTLVALLGVTVYIKHDEIGDAVPSLDSSLQRYVSLVDQGRVALAEAVVRLREGG